MTNEMAMTSLAFDYRRKKNVDDNNISQLATILLIPIAANVQLG